MGAPTIPFTLQHARSYDAFTHAIEHTRFPAFGPSGPPSRAPFDHVMEVLPMKISPFLLGLCLAVAGSCLAAAQDASTPSIPQVLQITREYTKPYKGGMAHDKTESAFITAMTKAKFPAYYIGMNSMSGRSRALFLTQYNSFAEWEKDNKTIDKSAVLSTELERASLADGELLEDVDSLVYTYDPDLSYHPHADISHARYMEITVFHVRLGHYKEWQQVSKMYRDVVDKMDPTAHWAMFDMAYGGDSGNYIAITAHQSMAEIDHGFEAGKKFVDAAGGQEGADKLDKLYGETVDAAHTELFSINPKQSYVNEAFIKADPDFWRPKPAKAAEAAAAKPAAKAAAPAPKPASR